MEQPLIKEVLLDAPLARVWQALTSKEELKQWCFEMDAFEPTEGFTFEFYGEKDDKKFLHHCKVLEVEKLRKMKWLWTYAGVPGETHVTFELFEEGNKTRLKLTHEGLENLPQEEPYIKANFVEGWNAILGELLPGYLKK